MSDQSRHGSGLRGNTGDAPGAAADGGRVGAGGLVVVPDLFGAPARAFARLAGDPKWIGNAALVLLLFAVATLVQLPQQLAMGEDMAIATMEKLNAPEEQIDEALARMPDPEDPEIGAVAQQAATSVLTVGAMMIIGGTLFHLIGRIAGAAAPWKMSMSVYTLVFVISALGAAVKGGVARISDTVEVTLGPGILFPGLDYHSLGAIFLDVFDVFSLWALFLLAMGTRIAFRVSPGASWGIAGTYWILKSSLVFGVRGFTAWMMGAL